MTGEIVLTALTLWLMFGIGNWASHVLTCPGCQRHIAAISEFFFHSLVQVCAWPLEAWAYYRRWQRRRQDPAAHALETQEPTPANAPPNAQELASGFKVVKMQRLEGETKEQFLARARREVEEIARRISQQSHQGP